MTKKRRAKGEGSVYRRKDGRVVGEYEDANGRTRYITSKTKTKTEMRALVRKALADRDEGVAYDSENLTVGSYMGRYLDYIRATVRQSTYERYEVLSRVHVVPVLGKVKLDRLNALHVQSLYGAKLDEGLSSGTVRSVHVLLLCALNRTVKWRLVKHNVCASVTPPKRQEKRIKPLTKEQVKRLLDTARKDDPLYALYVLACTTGMRQGELPALQWDCVDFEAGTIRVKRTVWKGKVSPPKTPRGLRTVKLSRIATDALRAHRESTNGCEWVFPNKAGKPMDRCGFSSRRWKPLLKRTGLPHTTRFHDLRHTCATLLLEQGINPKVVSDMLGHSDVGFTLSVYAHVPPSMQDHAADGMDQVLGVSRIRARGERG